MVILDPSQSPLSKALSTPHRVRGRGPGKKKVDPKDNVIRKKEDTLGKQVNTLFHSALMTRYNFFQKQKIAELTKKIKDLKKNEK